MPLSPRTSSDTGEGADVRQTRIVWRVRRVMALSTGMLVVATWPLWRPGTELPDIPWFEWAIDVPPEPWDWVWLIALGGLLAFQFLPRTDTRGWPSIVQGVLFGLALLLLPTDQHRLQPWVWQMLLAALIIALAPRAAIALEGLRGLTISIYVWSAISKLDWAFVEGHGQLLLDGLTQALGLSPALWTPQVRQSLALSFPIGELTVALLLALPWSRRWGLWGSIVMHSLLILTLGPLGLGHESGVLLWNVYFIVQNLLIFGRRAFPAGPGSEWDQTNPRQLRTQLTRMFVIVVCLLPGLSIAGLWDWWPSWAVYSARPAIVRMYVDRNDVARLPSSLQAHVGASSPLSDWYPVNFDAWSFATCWCPMYPQARYRLAVIQAASREGDITPRIVIESSPDRWTGERTEQEIDGKSGIDQRLVTFWFNMRGRVARSE